MLKTHDLKISVEFADAVLFGDKSFEVRENDRGFQKGDHIQFHVVDGRSLPISVNHPLNKETYEITYVLSGYHIDYNYVVLGIRPLPTLSTFVLKEQEDTKND